MLGCFWGLENMVITLWWPPKTRIYCTVQFVPKEGGVSLKRSQFGRGAFFTWGQSGFSYFIIFISVRSSLCKLTVSCFSYFIIFISVRSSLCKLTVSCFAEVTRQGLRLVAGAWNESTADKKNFSTFLLFANRWRACYSCFRLVFLFSFRFNIPICSLLFLSCLNSANVLGHQIWCNFCIFICLAFISCMSVCFCKCCLKKPHWFCLCMLSFIEMTMIVFHESG